MSELTGLRRALAAVAVLIVPLTVVATQPPAASAADPALRVFVLATDGLGPTEVTPATMPNLAALRAEGTWYEQARSVFVAETLPNHVAMATGVLPQRNGIVANSAFDPRRPGAGDVELSRPSMLTAETTVTRLERECPAVSTASIMSKTYLYDIFSGGHGNRTADLHWNAEPFYIPGSNHTLDQLTMERLRRWAFLEQPATPQFAFVNLGDIDRSGHLDPTGSLTGGEYPAGRRGAMVDTDALIGEFVQELKARGWWQESVVLVASDHGMDYSAPDRFVDLQAPLEAAGLQVGLDPSADDVGFSENGGAALVYVHEPDAVRQVRRVIASLPGVDRVITRADGSYRRYGLQHPRSGDLLVLVEDGFRVASGDVGQSNPLPGNHGHAVTQHSVLLVAGGHPAVADGAGDVDGPVVYRPGAAPRPPHRGPGNLSIAPTVASLFGVGQPRGGYDGAVLSEALTGSPRVCAAAAGRTSSRAQPDTDAAEQTADAAEAAADGTAANDADTGGPSLPATGGGLAAAAVVALAGAWLLLRLR